MLVLVVWVWEKSEFLFRDLFRTEQIRCVIFIMIPKWRHIKLGGCRVICFYFISYTVCCPKFGHKKSTKKSLRPIEKQKQKRSELLMQIKEYFFTTRLLEFTPTLQKTRFVSFFCETQSKKQWFQTMKILSLKSAACNV